MAGMEGFIEVVNEIEVKRLSDPIPVVKGDGTRRVHWVHDPIKIVSAVTFEIIIEKDKTFGGYVRSLYEKHLQNPKSAQQLTLKSYDDSYAIVDQATMPNFVFQSVKSTGGDTGKHQESKIIVVGQPQDWL